MAVTPSHLTLSMCFRHLQQTIPDHGLWLRWLKPRTNRLWTVRAFLQQWRFVINSLWLDNSSGPHFPASLGSQAIDEREVANHRVPTPKLNFVFSDFIQSWEMVANVCFLFSSSFRYVKFQVTCKICQSGKRDQTTKKTRTAAAATTAKPVLQVWNSRGRRGPRHSHSEGPFQNLTGENTRVQQQPTVWRRGLCLLPSGHGKIKSPVTARPGLDLSIRILPRQKINLQHQLKPKYRNPSGLI